MGLCAKRAFFRGTVCSKSNTVSPAANRFSEILKNTHALNSGPIYSAFIHANYLNK